MARSMSSAGCRNQKQDVTCLAAERAERVLSCSEGFPADVLETRSSTARGAEGTFNDTRQSDTSADEYCSPHAG